MTDLEGSTVPPDVVLRVECGSALTTTIGDVTVLITCQKSADGRHREPPSPPDSGWGQAAFARAAKVDLVGIADTLASADYDEDAGPSSMQVSGLGHIEVRNRGVHAETLRPYTQEGPSDDG
jgi:hypothetical protein